MKSAVSRDRISRMSVRNTETIQSEARMVRASVARLQRRLWMALPRGREGLSRYGVLGTLRRLGPMAVGALAQEQKLQPQSLTRILAALDRRGLVAKVQDPEDGRRTIIEITPAGTDALREHAAAQEAWLAGAMAAALSETERDLLMIAIRLLDRLAEQPDR